MLEMGSIKLALVALCDDVLLFCGNIFVLVVKPLQRWDGSIIFQSR